MRNRLMLVLLAGVMTSSPLPASERRPAHYVIALGDVPNDSRARVAELVDKTVGVLQPGDRLTLFSLPGQQTVGHVALPANRRINDRARDRRYGEERDAMKRTVMEWPAAGSAAGPARWPQGLPEIGKLIDPGVAGREVNVLVFDAGLYHDNREPRVSMRTGYPNGAAIRASQALSPYGTAERRERLNGVSIHFCHHEGPSDFINDQHQRLAEGAIATFVGEQGGVLASFTSAWAICTGRFLTATRTGAITPPPHKAGETPAMVILQPRNTDRDPAQARSTPVAEPVVTTPTVSVAPAVPEEPRMESPPVQAGVSPSSGVATAAPQPPVTAPIVAPVRPKAEPVATPVTKARPRKVKRRVVKRPPPRRPRVVVHAEPARVLTCDHATSRWVYSRRY